MKFSAGLALITFVAASLLAGAPSARESGTHYAADALESSIRSGELPGAISVFHRNGIQETACLGYADVAKKIPMSMDRMFMQCSQTKGVCGVSIAILLEEGKVHLDDPVSKYLLEFKNLQVKVTRNGKSELVPAKNVLTIRMVMNHTGGFPFEIPYKSKHGWTSKSLRDTAREAAANPLLFEPGTKVQYSNTGIDIGAAIVEVVTGEKWEDFLRKRVFTPLKMRDATFKPSSEQLSRAISLYDLHPGKPATYRSGHPAMPHPYNGPEVYPSAGAGLWLTAADQLKFYKMLMNLGVSEDGVRILKEDTVRKYLLTGTRPAGLGGYSMGLHTDPKTGWLGHGGAWGTTCMVNPGKKQLRLCVVQHCGRRFWSPAWNQASEKFFAEKIDSSGVDAYTGRMK